jgi:hypothetical protein
MNKTTVLGLVLVGLTLASASGCRLDLFRRGALFRQPSTVVAPQMDPCAPAAVDPAQPAMVIPAPTTSPTMAP